MSKKDTQYDLFQHHLNPRNLSWMDVRLELIGDGDAYVLVAHPNPGGEPFILNMKTEVVNDEGDGRVE